MKTVQDQLGHASATTTLDRYGNLMPDSPSETGARLDRAIFGEDVVKPLSVPPITALSIKQKPLEVVTLQGDNLVAGRGFEQVNHPAGVTFGL